MARLKNEVKIYIVRSLAVFNTPKEVVTLIKEDFGIDVTPQTVECYDPTKRAGQDLSQKLREEFEATRKEFVENTSNIPIANAAYRLQRLQRIVDRVGKNSVLEMQALEQAAKESGGAFTNRKEITGKGGEPLAINAKTNLTTFTPEQLEGRTAQELSKLYFG